MACLEQRVRMMEDLEDDESKQTMREVGFCQRRICVHTGDVFAHVLRGWSVTIALERRFSRNTTHDAVLLAPERYRWCEILYDPCPAVIPPNACYVLSMRYHLSRIAHRLSSRFIIHVSRIQWHFTLARYSGF